MRFDECRAEPLSQARVSLAKSGQHVTGAAERREKHAYGACRATALFAFCRGNFVPGLESYIPVFAVFFFVYAILKFFMLTHQK